MHGEANYAYGMWVVVAINIGIFLFFILSFFKPHGRQAWRNMGLVSAFFIALFAEMYGFPLTIYILTSWLGEAYPILQPFSHKSGHLWVVVFGGSDFAWVVVMGLSLVLLMLGYLLLAKGWYLIHSARGNLVTDGVYAYVRHPQYTGLFLMIISFLVQWPTILTVMMAPVLVYAYVRLARFEERYAVAKFGLAYLVYARKTPAFIPSFIHWKAFFIAKRPLT